MTDLDDLFPPDEQGVENKIDVERAIGRLSRREAAVHYLWVTGYTQAVDGAERRSRASFYLQHRRMHHIGRR